MAGAMAPVRQLSSCADEPCQRRGEPREDQHPGSRDHAPAAAADVQQMQRQLSSGSAAAPATATAIGQQLSGGAAALPAAMQPASLPQPASPPQLQQPQALGAAQAGAGRSCRLLRGRGRRSRPRGCPCLCCWKSSSSPPTSSRASKKLLPPPPPTVCHAFHPPAASPPPPPPRSPPTGYPRRLRPGPSLRSARKVGSSTEGGGANDARPFMDGFLRCCSGSDVTLTERPDLLLDITAFQPHQVSAHVSATYSLRLVAVR